jgi:hypothetical protein
MSPGIRPRHGAEPLRCRSWFTSESDRAVVVDPQVVIDLVTASHVSTCGTELFDTTRGITARRPRDAVCEEYGQMPEQFGTLSLFGTLNLSGQADQLKLSHGRVLPQNG